MTSSGSFTLMAAPSLPSFSERLRQAQWAPSTQHPEIIIWVPHADRFVCLILSFSAHIRCQASTITDTSTIKDVLILRPPSNAPDDLTILYEFQLTNLNNLRRADSDVELGEGVTPISITEIIRTSSSANEANLIATHLGPKYVVPPQLATALKAGSSRGRGGTKRVFRSRDDHPTNTRPVDTTAPPPTTPGTTIFWYRSLRSLLQMSPLAPSMTPGSSLTLVGRCFGSFTRNSCKEI